jgi:hypothetical protein
MFANCQLMGMDMAFPDVCKSPVPIPFPNMALGPMAIPNAWNILFMACRPTTWPRSRRSPWAISPGRWAA